MADVTPDAPCDLAGYAAREQPNTGVHDPVHARALVLQAEGGSKIALVVCETLGFDPATDARIRDRIRMDGGVDGVLLCATHTHAAPASMNLVQCGTSDEAWMAWLEVRLASLVREASAATVPATCRRSMARSSMSMNRRARVEGATRLLTTANQRPPDQPAGPVDHQVQTLQFLDAAGTERALVYSYACHPVGLGAQNRLISADWPFFAASELEEAGGRGAVLFMQGPCGDINPSVACRGFEETEKAGRDVGRAVLSAVAAPRESPVTALAFAEEEMDLPLQDGLGHVRVNMAALALGVEVGFVTMPGEAFVELGLWTKADSPFPATIVLGYSNGNIGYLPTRSAYPLGGYEVDSAFKYYDYPAAVAPEAGEAVVAAAGRLLRRCASEVGNL